MLRQNSQKYNIFKPTEIHSSLPSAWSDFLLMTLSRYVWVSLPPCILLQVRLGISSPLHPVCPFPFINHETNAFSMVSRSTTWQQAVPLNLAIGVNYVPSHFRGVGPYCPCPGHLQLWWVFFSWNIGATPILQPLPHALLFMIQLSYPTVAVLPLGDSLSDPVGPWSSPSHSSSQSSSDNHILPTSGFKSSFLVC